MTQLDKSSTLLMVVVLDISDLVSSSKGICCQTLLQSALMQGLQSFNEDGHPILLAHTNCLTQF